MSFPQVVKVLLPHTSQHSVPLNCHLPQVNDYESQVSFLFFLFKTKHIALMTGKNWKGKRNVPYRCNKQKHKFKKL